jgi:RHS repeat-associated protein
LTSSAHKTEKQNCTQTSLFLPFTFTGKERDEETGYGYFGARYIDHELTTMWLSVDPMADKYPSISPYAYCAWNPVKLVDPDGNEAIDNDDWYINSKGEIRWFHSTAETYTYEGEEYTRYGQTASMTNGDGEFIYGDQFGHTHSEKPLSKVNISETLTDFERTMRNPLVQSIHQSGADFWGDPVTEAVVDATLFVVTGGTEAVAKGVAKSMIKRNVKQGAKTNFEKLVIEAQQRYPRKAGKIEMHHIVPKYLGGNRNGPMVGIDGAYHQVITNEFRSLYPYGQNKPSIEQLERILESVYSKYPIPSR